MLVSAIIPTYNRAKTIGRAVNSVLAQTWTEIEIIIVDDGSTDQTDEVLSAYRDKIRVIRQRNAGPAAARNTGIEAATGEVISFLDSDDTWLPQKTERQVKLLQRTESSGVVCCVCNARMFFPSRTITSFQAAQLHPDLAEGIWSNPTEILTDRFLLFNQVAAVRREVFNEVGLFNPKLRIMEDYDFALRFSLMGPWAYIADPLADWHGGAANSLSNTASERDAWMRAREILLELSCSPKWGPLMPQSRLQRQLRFLEQRISAANLSTGSNRIARGLGRLLLAGLRGVGAVQRRLPSYPQMITQPLQIV